MSDGQDDPPYSFASNVDGDRHVVVLAEDRDMTGWSVEVLRRSSGQSDACCVNEFEQATLWGKGHPNFLGSGDEVAAWIAWCDHGEELLRFLPPTG
jgi:hypothetical protein